MKRSGEDFLGRPEGEPPRRDGRSGLGRPPGSRPGSDLEKTQEYLGRLVAYLEGLYTSMDWESDESTPITHGLPPRLARILSDSGYLQGLNLKTQGSLSSDLQEFIRSVGFAFEMEANPVGVFKLPFIDNEMSIQRKTLNPFMEKAWMVYHAALLSSYALRPLRFERVAEGPQGRLPGGDLEEIVRVLEAPPGEEFGPAPGLGPDRANIHAVNNALAGIVSYVSLIQAERKTDADLQQKLALVLEAARKAGDALRKKPSSPPS